MNIYICMRTFTYRYCQMISRQKKLRLFKLLLKKYTYIYNLKKKNNILFKLFKRKEF